MAGRRGRVKFNFYEIYDVLSAVSSTYIITVLLLCYGIAVRTVAAV